MYMQAIRANSSTKYGELPSCVRQSARELIASSFIIDLDNDQVISPRRGEAMSTCLPPLPEAAASALLTGLQRAINPTMQGGGGGGAVEEGPYQGYGYR